MKQWRHYNLGPFVLGTAQLGLPYGIANRSGQPTQRQAVEIISTAWNAGVRVFDTAQQYGNSEQVLGACLEELNISEQALVITKLPTSCFYDEQSIMTAVDRSLEALRRTAVFAVMAHSADVLKTRQNAQSLFKLLKSHGKTAFTGVSVYSVAQAEIALETEDFDFIQIPLNALDRRTIMAKLTVRACDKGKLLLFRSAFLQGLLLLDPHAGLPAKVEFARVHLDRWRRSCQDAGITPEVAALKTADRLAGVFPLVIGAESANQVLDNSHTLNRNIPDLDELIHLTEPLAQCCNERLLNPALW